MADLRFSLQLQPVQWADGSLRLLDQRKLPAEETYLLFDNAPEAAQAITDMVVRGAPAIGITAAYAMVLSAQQHQSTADYQAKVKADMQTLAASRPTAVNLFWALAEMEKVLQQYESADWPTALLAKAVQIHEEDISANFRMGALGAELLQSGSRVLTHCNAGALATGGHGTALGVIRSAWQQNKITQVYADETRPWMQGARLTAWELLHDNIPVTLQCEGAAGHLMQQGLIDWVIVGSDRIAANGDVANKIGTYSLAVLARHHGVKFMVAAPTSTIDMQTLNGVDIPIENRDSQEVLACGGHALAASGADARNPAFDVTPADLVDFIVTEKGIIEAPTSAKMQSLLTA